jgi:hypothetical protein
MPEKKTNRGLNPQRSDFFVVKINCVTASRHQFENTNGDFPQEGKDRLYPIYTNDEVTSAYDLLVEYRSR